MAKTVKLADIAKRTGVSVVTVSKALSGQKGVSETMRRKIKKIASDLGYISPSEERMMSERKSFNIGVLVSQRYFAQMQSFYWVMYQELVTRAVNFNCFTMLEVVSEEEEENAISPKLLEGDKINGLVVIGLMKEKYLEKVNEDSHVPIVFLDFYNKKFKCDAIITDNFYGMYQLTEYLCKLGHRKIAYVGTLLSTNSITDRYYGYCKALGEYGIPLREDYVINDRTEKNIKENFTYSLPEDMPTAFVCNCDLTAYEIIDLLKEKGYKVPEDISVVGFDDYSVPGDYDINLTTYAVDVKGMVRRTIKILLNKMTGDFSKHGTAIVAGEMKIRESTKEIQ